MTHSKKFNPAISVWHCRDVLSHCLHPCKNSFRRKYGSVFLIMSILDSVDFEILVLRLFLKICHDLLQKPQPCDLHWHCTHAPIHSPNTCKNNFIILMTVEKCHSLIASSFRHNVSGYNGAVSKGARELELRSVIRRNTYPYFSWY